jgi:hypothetical protein
MQVFTAAITAIRRDSIFLLGEGVNTPHRAEGGYQRFRGTYSLHLNTKHEDPSSYYTRRSVFILYAKIHAILYAKIHFHTKREDPSSYYTRRSMPYYTRIAIIILNAKIHLHIIREDPSSYYVKIHLQSEQATSRFPRTFTDALRDLTVSQLGISKFSFSAPRKSSQMSRACSNGEVR